jgi:hypothetical protein
MPGFKILLGSDNHKFNGREIWHERQWGSNITDGDAGGGRWLMGLMGSIIKI